MQPDNVLVQQSPAVPDQYIFPTYSDVAGDHVLQAAGYASSDMENPTARTPRTADHQSNNYNNHISY